MCFERSPVLLKALSSKLQEALISVLPVACIVFLLYLSPFTTLSNQELCVFFVTTVLLILGIGLFNLGADLAMTPMGEQVGVGLTKSRKTLLLLTISFLLGVLITVSEPDLTVLAAQLKELINGDLLIWTVGIGVGLFLTLSVIKIICKIRLSSLLMYFYMILFAVASLLIMKGSGDFLSVAFDSGGVTTGPVTVPFMMALGVGIASAVGGKNASENSFGMVAMCSVGPILAVLLLGLSSSGEMTYAVPYQSVAEILPGAAHTILSVMEEVAIALGMIVAAFVVLQLTVLHLPKKKLIQIAIGILYTYFGLVLFLGAVNVGYMPVGYRLGCELAAQAPQFVIGFGFLLGLVVVLAEPAVHVLKKQVESVTDGRIRGTSMMLALSIGVGISLALSMLRIIFDFSVFYYLIPGYLLSLGLSFFVPSIYTAIAFDSGGVASGPLTSGFILPFAVGICVMTGGVDKVLENAFGIVAMVAMTPLITIQLLGFRSVVSAAFRRRIAMRRINEADDDRIIEFM
ncbi:MAG: DUF1538 domain-containing protein [Clostridia bacterium]|nr:DUF1538 domain-containing protein [Clostridia bacterium]